MLLVGQGLQIGNIIYVQGSEEQDGTVLKQRPFAEVGAMIRVGEFVDLWVAGEEPVLDIE